MLPSFSTDIEEISVALEIVFSEDGSKFLDQIIRTLGESILTEAFNYAKVSQLDDLDYEIIDAARAILPDEIWEFVETSIRNPTLKYPLITDLENRDENITVNSLGADHFTRILEYFVVKVVKGSSKKGKEAGLNEVTEQLIKDAINGDEELKAIFFPFTSTSETSEADEASALLNEIIDLLHIDRSTLKGASEEEIVAIEEKFELPLPSYLRSLLKITDGSMSMGLNVFLFPSLSDMDGQFFYGSYLPKIYRINRWIPYQDLDYDFCWEILDVRTGGVILQFDLECESSWQNGKELKDLLTLMKRLKLFRDYLLNRDDKESLKASDLKFDDGRTYEKSQGYESKAMNSRYKAMYDHAYEEATAIRRPSKKARK